MSIFVNFSSIGPNFKQVYLKEMIGMGSINFFMVCQKHKKRVDRAVVLPSKIARNEITLHLVEKVHFLIKFLRMLRKK